MKIKRMFCPECDELVASIGRQANHVLHLLMTIVMLFVGFIFAGLIGGILFVAIWLFIWGVASESAARNWACQKCGSKTFHRKAERKPYSITRIVVLCCVGAFVAFIFVLSRN